MVDVCSWAAAAAALPPGDALRGARGGAAGGCGPVSLPSASKLAFIRNATSASV